MEVILKVKAKLQDGFQMKDITHCYLLGCEDSEVLHISKKRIKKDTKSVFKTLLSDVSRISKRKKKKIISNRRNRPYVYSRFTIAAILKWEHGVSLKNIGIYIGNRDHTSVIHGLRTAENLITTNDEEFKPYANYIFANLSEIPNRLITTKNN